MALKVYDLEQCEEWDRVVKSFGDYDTYWLSGYAKAFKIHGDGEPLLFYYNDNDCRGINVVMKRDLSDNVHFKNLIQENKLFDFATPYGYGGWLIEGTNTRDLFDSYCKWCINNNIISEFVRFEPVLENHIINKGFYEVVSLGNTITMDLSSPETIWNNLTSKNRNMIRKAIKNEVEIYSGRFPEIYRAFKKIYDETMDKDNAERYYYFQDDFYKSILNDLPDNALVFYAVYQNKVIAASIMLVANHKINYHLSGSLKEYSYLAPTNLILYRAALWGNANNCKTLYLGGGVGSEEDSLYRFKKAFYRKENLKKFYIGKKIFKKDIYNSLLSIRGDIGSNYFPKYRA